MMGDPEGTGVAFELSEKIRQYRHEIVKIMGFEHIHELGLVTDSVYGSKEYVMEQAGVSESALKRLPIEGEHYGARIDYAPDAADALQKGWEYHNFHHTVLIADITLLNKIISEVRRIGGCISIMSLTARPASLSFLTEFIPYILILPSSDAA